MQRTRIFHTIFLIICVLGALFLATELLFQSFGSSICPNEGCRTTAQYVRFGERFILLAGLAAFVCLALLTSAARRAERPAIENLIDLALVAILASEGFFMGYLAFRLHAACLICITIFALMTLLGLVRLAAGQRRMLAGFGAMVAVFGMQYVLLPAGIPVNLPQERLVLFYSRDCKHCAEVLKEFEARQVTAAHVPAAEYARFLKDLGIEHIPTLMVNDPYQKLFLTGNDAISRYLDSCALQQKTARQPQRRPAKQRESAAPAPGGVVIDLFSQPGFLSAPSGTAGDDGMCREDAACK